MIIGQCEVLQALVAPRTGLLTRSASPASRKALAVVSRSERVRKRMIIGQCEVLQALVAPRTGLLTRSASPASRKALAVVCAAIDAGHLAKAC